MKQGIRGTAWRRFAAVTAVGLALAACSVESDSGGEGDGGGDSAGGGDGELELAENTGSISMSGAGTGVDAEAVQIVADAAGEGEEFSATYTGSESFEQDIVIQIEGGTPPDIALFPQPGAVVEQAQQGNAVALEDLGYDIAELEERFGEYLMSLGEVDGKHYGLPLDVNYKSAVWYPKGPWDEAGWEIPETYEDLIALSDEMVADGTAAPWCIGTGSDAATGWPGTDWIENIILIGEGTDVYDRWVTNELKFDSPEIRSAFERFGEILFTEGYVFGGSGNVSSTDFRDAPDPMFNDPPNCWMHRQATFIPAFFPDGLEPGTDYDFFPFPTIDGNSGTLMAGGYAAIFNAREEVKTFIDNYTTAETQCLFGTDTGSTTISANFNVDLECYENELIKQSAEPLQESLKANEARFDASDLMPPAVGSGEFWNQMNNFTDSGPDNLDEVLPAIDSAWPADSGSSDSSESDSDG